MVIMTAITDQTHLIAVFVFLWNKKLIVFVLNLIENGTILAYVRLP